MGDGARSDGGGSGPGDDGLVASRQLLLRTRVYFFDIRRNASGFFLSITEKRGERRNRILVAGENLARFVEMLEECGGIAREAGL